MEAVESSSIRIVFYLLNSAEGVTCEVCLLLDEQLFSAACNSELRSMVTDPGSLPGIFLVQGPVSAQVVQFLMSGISIEADQSINISQSVICSGRDG